MNLRRKFSLSEQVRTAMLRCSALERHSALIAKPGRLFIAKTEETFVKIWWRSIWIARIVLERLMSQEEVKTLLGRDGRSPPYQ